MPLTDCSDVRVAYRKVLTAHININLHACKRANPGAKDAPDSRLCPAGLHLRLVIIICERPYEPPQASTCKVFQRLPANATTCNRGPACQDR
jgi:hypothetical protein